MLYILTGGPLCGLSSLVALLKEKGHQFLEDASQPFCDNVDQDEKKTISYFEQMVENRFPLEQPRYRDTSHTFSEYGIPDFLVEGQREGIAFSGHLLNAMRKTTYKGVFLLEPLPELMIRAKGFRGDYKENRKQQHLVARCYHKLGYEPMLIEYMPLAMRAEYILKLTHH